MPDSIPTSGPTLGLVLHAHLPAVPADDPEAPEAGWFYEVLAESYIPLLKRLGQLAREGVRFRLAMHWSPVVGAALGDARVRRGFVGWLENRIEGAVVAERGRWIDLLKTFTHDWKRDVSAQWEALVDSGHVEPVAGSATHALLPLLANQPAFLRAQIGLGRAEVPGARGFWLPETACSPEVAAALREGGVEWTVADDGGESPFLTPDGLVVFPVHRALSNVFRGEEENPDIDGVRALLAAAPGFSVVPVEMETLGHCWPGGIDFLEAILRTLETRTPGDFLCACPGLAVRPVASLTPVDDGGYCETWLNERTAWLYPEWAETARAWLAATAEASPHLPRVSGALAQSAREFLLCQFSDWSLMATADPDGLGRLAESRLRAHLCAARELSAQARAGVVSENLLASREAAGFLFPNLDWRALGNAI